MGDSLRPQPRGAQAGPQAGKKARKKGKKKRKKSSGGSGSSSSSTISTSEMMDLEGFGGKRETDRLWRKFQRGSVAGRFFGSTALHPHPVLLQSEPPTGA